MNPLFKYTFILFILASPFWVNAQTDLEEQKVLSSTFTVKGYVRETDTNSPIKNVNIQVNGGAYTASNNAGEFRIQVRVGDELLISHKDFETIYYTIKDGQRITVNVEPRNERSGVSTFKAKKKEVFISLMDSAVAYKKRSAEKSIQFITESIKESTSVKQNAEAFELLADVYIYWKQYDLAVTNYRISLNSLASNDVNLKLGVAYQKNGNYQESLAVFEELKKEELSNYQIVELYEGLGDTHFLTKNFEAAIAAYKKGLNVAKKHLISPKVTDLNSKIAQALDQSGAVAEAEVYYDSSLQLASKQNKTRSVIEKIKVADFNNANQNFDTEIKLRKESIQDIIDIESDSLIDNASALTVQKQNYKIGNAYYSKKNYAAAIPYLEESIKEADKREDLVVEKDAKRKLSEVYRDAGEFAKALEAYEDYTTSVEKLYIKKEQQITQVARFNKNIRDKQNRITSLEKDRLLTLSQMEATSERNRSQKLIIYSLIGGVLLLLLTAYLMYKYIKQQKLANNLLALKSLRSQMNPHFIFNALNSVNSFIATNDERTANKYLSDFSQLMRAVLENSEEDFIPLQKEIELLELYTKLEHFRFQDKFDYSITVEDDVAVDDFQIPPMLLQPYIENAVWHGLRYKKDKGKLEISIKRKAKDEIQITVADNGIGRARSKALKTANQQKQNSKGMGNIKKRVSILNEMYKDKVDVFIDDAQEEEDAGTKVIVSLKKD